MVIPMTAMHAYRGNTPIIIASSVAIHQAGVQTATNIETQREHTDTVYRTVYVDVKSMRVKIRPNGKTVM